MSKPTVKVLGVYRLIVTDELVREQHAILCPGEVEGASYETSEQQVRDQLGSVVLVEVLVLDRDSRFDMGDFAQAQTGVSREYWQTAWAEAYLSLDGTGLAVDRWSQTPVSSDLRIAFFMHGWDTASPYSRVTVRLPVHNRSRCQTGSERCGAFRVSRLARLDDVASSPSWSLARY